MNATPEPIALHAEIIEPPTEVVVQAEVARQQSAESQLEKVRLSCGSARCSMLEAIGAVVHLEPAIGCHDKMLIRSPVWGSIVVFFPSLLGGFAFFSLCSRTEEAEAEAEDEEEEEKLKIRLQNEAYVWLDRAKDLTTIGKHSKLWPSMIEQPTDLLLCHTNVTCLAKTTDDISDSRK